MANVSVRVLIATFQDILEDGFSTLNEEELKGVIETLTGGLTPRAADGFTAEQIAQIRRIAKDVVSDGGE